MENLDSVSGLAIIITCGVFLVCTLALVFRQVTKNKLPKHLEDNVLNDGDEYLILKDGNIVPDLSNHTLEQAVYKIRKHNHQPSIDTIYKILRDAHWIQDHNPTSEHLAKATIQSLLSSKV